jgi:hypothetical protein
MLLLRHLALNAAVGVIAGQFCLAALLWLDPGGLRTLALHADHVWIALPLLAFAFAITFGGCAAATSIMLLPREEAGDTGGPDRRRLRPAPEGGLVPARVRARRR